MDEDLALIKREIEKRKMEQAQAQTDSVVSEQEKKPQDRASELVDAAFGQAIVKRVVEDESVQSELLESADTVIHNKMNAIKARADREDKETHFNNKRGACECFGYNETTTEKWAVNLMSLWHNVMTAIWLVAGFVTFAPITFISKKISVIFKKAWVAITLAVVIYLAVLAAPFLTRFLIQKK